MILGTHLSIYFSFFNPKNSNNKTPIRTESIGENRNIGLGHQLMRPWVMRWLILSLFFSSGMKITFVLLLPTCFSVYR